VDISFLETLEKIRHQAEQLEHGSKDSNFARHLRERGIK